jgi:predicted phosphodiesterase
MPDDDLNRWVLMSARRRLASSRVVLELTRETKAQARSQLEASRRLLGRTRVDVIIYGHPHEPEGTDK